MKAKVYKMPQGDWAASSSYPCTITDGLSSELDAWKWVAHHYEKALDESTKVFVTCDIDSVPCGAWSSREKAVEHIQRHNCIGWQSSAFEFELDKEYCEDDQP